MGRYDSKQAWPKAFYQDGGGAYGLINPNKIQSGVLQGSVKIGTNGPTLDPGGQQMNLGNLGSITSPANIIINNKGITLGPTQHITLQNASQIIIQPPPSSSSGIVYSLATVARAPEIIGPIYVQGLDSRLKIGDGVGLFTAYPGDMMLGLYAWTTETFSASTLLYVGVNFSAAAGITSTTSIGAAQVSYSLPGVPSSLSSFMGLVGGGEISASSPKGFLQQATVSARVPGAETNTRGLVALFFVMLRNNGTAGWPTLAPVI